jgi:hypothetical protein
MNMDLISLIISGIALIFSFYTFWFLIFRKGSIKLARPNCFKAISNTEMTLFQIPIVIHNDGAKIKIINDLRLVVFIDGIENILEYSARLEAITFIDQPQREMPLPLILQSNSVFYKIIEFKKRKCLITFEKVKIQFKLEAKFDSYKEWDLLGVFDLDFSKIDYQVRPEELAAYPNR